MNINLNYNNIILKINTIIIKYITYFMISIIIIFTYYILHNY